MIMNKNIIKYTAAALTATILSTASVSCSDEQGMMSGQGRLMLNTAILSDVKVASRTDTQQELADKAIIWISNSKGAVRKYNGLSEVPAEGVELLCDHYVAEVWTGDSLSASFDTKWFKGREEFDIEKNQTTNVNIKCTVANTVASVVYKDGVDDLLSDYKMTVGHSRGDLVFEGRDDRKGYFMMPNNDKSLKWNLEGKLANGTVYTRSGVIENAKPATEYIITISYSDKPQETGGGYFRIEIEENPIVVEAEIEIKMAPQFSGYDFNLDDGLEGEVGKFTRRSVLVSAVGNLTSVVLKSPVFSSFISGEDVDLLNMEPQVADALTAHGINNTYSYNSEIDASVAKVNFEETFLNSLQEGEYAITFEATDQQGKTTSHTLNIVATNAPARVEDVLPGSVWATSVTLTARVMKPEQNPAIAYRKSGESAWTEISGATTANSVITAALTGLEPGTTYEYTVVATDYVSKSVKTFTTESAPQLPNAGFEEWQDSKAPYLIYASGTQQFWDSGNHGSATMGKNVTIPATDKFHSGSRSIKLESQFVGVGIAGKFAAGNVFVGKYLATVGTDGVLGWGRAWNSRPKALKGWMHYTANTINYKGDGAPDTVNKGDMDTGIIYIAILDDTMDEYDSEKFPVIVKTKKTDRQLFDKNAANVIAYGELVITSSTTGDDMVEFTIPLTYNRNDVKASNLMITASASRYGDFFTGGPSTLYLDDLQLVY